MQTDKRAAARDAPILIRAQRRLSPDLDEALRMLKAFELTIEPVKTDGK